MDVSDNRNSQVHFKSGRPNYHDISKSARHKTPINVSDFKRSKSSIPHRENKDVTTDSRDDSFSLLFQKQILSKRAFYSSDKPIIPTIVIRRTSEEKMKSPDRISLDRQNFTCCPILENEDNLRLLNFQYNYITKIQHLDKLRKLILLDLYDNRIEKISGLDNLKSLRVLMLGRNRINKIEGLESLCHLDVLDLHANYLNVIENISHLTELRVLNIAGNNIKTLSNLKGLMSLIEVNARRNCIELASEIDSDNCPNLQRLYLSYNNITKISDVSCLTDLAALTELSLDNNPVCRHNNLRFAIICNFPQLEQLDLKYISEEERCRARQVINRLELNTKPNSHLSRHLNLSATRNADQQSANIQRFHSLKERHRSSLSSKRSVENWNQQTSNVSPQLSITCFGGSNKTDCNSNTLVLSELSSYEPEMPSKSIKVARHSQSNSNSESKEFVAIEETLSKTKISNCQTSTESAKPPSVRSVIIKPSPSTGSRTDSLKTVASSGNLSESCDAVIDVSSSESKQNEKEYVEYSNDSEIMKFSSVGALKSLDDKEFWSANSNFSSIVTTLIFQGVDFDETEKYFSSVKARFPNLKKISFSDSNISCFNQINHLANLKRLEELVISDSGNPIMSFKLLRSYVVFRLNHLGLRKFNNEEIVDHDYFTARRYFIPLSVIGPNQITQLHLIGVLTDTKKRELLHASNDSFNMLSYSSKIPNINIDLVGRSGILLPNPVRQSQGSDDNTERRVCSLIVNSLINSVDSQCNFEELFHNQWLMISWKLISMRLRSMVYNRSDYMKQQIDLFTVPKTAKI